MGEPHWPQESGAIVEASAQPRSALRAAPSLIVGTAGHIDHGKSSLVRALTGVDPDRLPEEKARGMTIDLGFAHLRAEGASLHFVDVPGHERFIRNMVAGATGVDLALLVVAADDGVMPQTREHAEVLRHLGIRKCHVVVTKCDLVDRDWATAVAADAEQLVSRAGLAMVGKSLTSVQSGAGLHELVAALAAHAKGDHGSGVAAEWFRMPIDRVFSAPGRGTVVTGAVWHGQVAPDADLELWPIGLLVRARELQSHQTALAATAGRLRLAINLPGVAVEQVRRGYELATPGVLAATDRIDVELNSLLVLGQQNRSRFRVRLHLATAETLAELRLTEPARGASLERAAARLHTAEPIVATWGQPFVIRDESANRTLGGGRVIRPTARGSLLSQDAIAGLTSADGEVRAATWIEAAGWVDVSAARLAAETGLADEGGSAECLRRLVDSGRVIRLQDGTQRLYVGARTFADWADSLRRRISAFAEANPRAAGIPRREFSRWMPRVCPERFHAVLIEHILQAGLVRCAADYVSVPAAGPHLSAQDESLFRQLVAAFEAGGLQPPTVRTLPFRTARNETRLSELAELACAQGRLHRLEPGVWIHDDAWRAAARRVADLVRASGPVLVAAVRDALGSTRKVVVPLLERFDAAGITKRVGDTRVLGTNALPPD